MSVYPFHFLTIAGSDNGGGAGIQADIKTASALGGYAASAITSVTVQDTQKLYDQHIIPTHIVKAQIEYTLEDIPINVIKIGLMPHIDMIYMLAEILKQYPEIPVIIDPVLATSGGQEIVSDAMIDVYKEMLFPRALLVTPNLPELKRLSGMGFNGIKSALHAAHSLLPYCQNILVKGGHSCPAEYVTDILVNKEGGTEKFQLPFIDTKAGHGTGCTLSSAIASYSAMGYDLKEAISFAKKYTHQALKNAPIIGKGKAPLKNF